MYHDAFNPDVEDVNELKVRYRQGKVGDVEVKQKLARALNTLLDPMRERRARALEKPGQLRDMLFASSARAQKVAAETMARVREAMRIKY